MSVVRAVSWCMMWCGEVRSQGSQADALSTVPTCACGFLRLSQRERTPRFVFQICPSLVGASFWEEGGQERCVNKCENDQKMLGVIKNNGCPPKKGSFINVSQGKEDQTIFAFKYPDQLQELKQPFGFTLVKLCSVFPSRSQMIEPFAEDIRKSLTMSKWTPLLPLNAD